MASHKFNNIKDYPTQGLGKINWDWQKIMIAFYHEVSILLVKAIKIPNRCDIIFDVAQKK